MPFSNGNISKKELLEKFGFDLSSEWANLTVGEGKKARQAKLLERPLALMDAAGNSHEGAAYVQMPSAAVISQNILSTNSLEIGIKTPLDNADPDNPFDLALLFEKAGTLGEKFTLVGVRIRSTKEGSETLPAQPGGKKPKMKWEKAKNNLAEESMGTATEFIQEIALSKGQVSLPTVEEIIRLLGVLNRPKNLLLQRFCSDTLGNNSTPSLDS